MDRIFIAISKLFEILSDKFKGQKRDYFLSEKYFKIKNSYGGSVLDLGSGNGEFSHFLESQGHSVRGVDVVNKNKHASIEPIIYNGLDIPFKDKQFNTSIAMFVLHHAQDQIQLLNELKRVTRDYVIIGEDVIRNVFDKILGNIHLNTSPWSKAEDSFRRDQVWQDIFQNLGFKLVTKVTIGRHKYPVYPVKRMIYVLAVND